jgi:hypothetical protein
MLFPRKLVMTLIFTVAATFVLAEVSRAWAARSVDQWEQLFLGAWSSEYNTYTPKSLSGDSWHIYDMAYPLNANYLMFRATGKTQYLDRALFYIDNLMRTARVSSSLPSSQFKDSYLTWVNKSHPTGPGEYPLFESYGWRYVTCLLRAMRDNPTVYANPSYKARYDSILAFTEKNIWEKWYGRATAHLYRSRTHMASHWAMIALNLERLTANETRRAQYRAVRDNITFAGMPLYGGASLRGQMRLNPVNSSAYFWDDNWGSTARPGQDVAHGNAVAAYIAEAHDLGVHWTRRDVVALANLVKNVIFKPTGGYARYVDGSGSGNGWLNDGFAQLGRYDADLQARIETHNVGRNTTLYAAGALSEHLLEMASPD